MPAWRRRVPRAATRVRAPAPAPRHPGRRSRTSSASPAASAPPARASSRAIAPRTTRTSPSGCATTGAVILGKTNMDEFAMGSSTEHSAYGPTANPWALDRVPGGSSGGSAAAVAAFHAPLSIGTDTGGSIRQPAALTGIVGLKPTYGRVSRYGIVAFASSLDQIGPFARDVRGAATLLHAVAGRDERDSTSSPEPVPDELLTLAHSDDEAAGRLRGKRLGLPREYFVAGMEPGVEARVREAVAALEAAGAIVEEVSLPHTEYGLATYYIVAPAEASANLARYDGIRYGPRLGRRRRPRRRTSRPAASCSGRRSSAGSCSGRTRCRPATTTRTTSRRRRSGRSSRATSTRSGRRASTRWSRRHRRPSPSGSATASPIRSRCTCPMRARCRSTWPDCPASPSRPACPRVCRSACSSSAPPWSELELFTLARGYEAITADADWRDAGADRPGRPRRPLDAVAGRARRRPALLNRACTATDRATIIAAGPIRRERTCAADRRTP